MNDNFSSIKMDLADIHESVNSLQIYEAELDQRVSTIESIVYTAIPIRTPQATFIMDPND